MRVSEKTQSIGLTGVQNARELGGYPAENGRTVKHGCLLRTAKLSTGNEEDFRKLREDYHLTKVIDFRSDEEIYGSPEMSALLGASENDMDPELSGVQYIHLPILDLKKLMENLGSMGESQSDFHDKIQMIELSIETGFVSDELYIGFVEEDMGKKGYRSFFQELLSTGENESVLFHCTQGKDRTGVAAMLILSALGASEEIILQDYLLTNEFNRKIIEKERNMLEMSGKVPDEKIDTFLMAMDQVDRNTMVKLLTHIKENYGSVTEYMVNELGISGEEISALRRKYLV